MTVFNHLNVPDSWNQYWSKYPEGYTVLEALINWVSQVDSMVDNVNDLNTRMDDFIAQFDTNLQDKVKTILTDWQNDGTLEEIINSDLFATLQTNLDNSINDFRAELDNKVDTIVSGSPFAVYADIVALTTAYPAGRTGIAVLQSDGGWYYYNNGWVKGGTYVSPVTYDFKTATNGTLKNLNSDPAWTANPDITTLSTGFYTAYIQTPAVTGTDSPATGTDPNAGTYPNPAYPIAINFPSQIQGNVCTIKVFDTGVQGRVDYEVEVNWTNQVYRASKRYDGSMSKWSNVLLNDDSRPKQQFRLSYATGGSKSWQNATSDPAQQGQDNLVVPITSLDSGFIYGSINAVTGTDNRNLPPNFPVGQVCSVLITSSDSGRKLIYLHANYSGTSYIGYSSTDASGLFWKRIDQPNDPIESDKLGFEYRMNAIQNANFKTLITTDVHAQFGAISTQIGYVNTSHYQNLDDLDKNIDVNDVTLHLGDWMDGNNAKDLSQKSIIKWGKQFYAQPNRYGIFGNHDYNGQWDNGVSGNNGANTSVPSYYFTQSELSKYLTPFNQPYYFVDNAAKKIRMIFLNSFDISGITGADGKFIRDPHQSNGFGNTQVLWFRDTLNTVPVGYNVVIFTHETFDNVFDDQAYYNGDTMRKIAEGYQAKTTNTFAQSDITSGDPEWNYFNVSSSFDYRTANGKILAVVSGHRHLDESTFVTGIRYIVLLCSRAEGGTDPVKKPARNYWDATSEAITMLEFDTTLNKINLYRFGAGVETSYNMFN